MRAPSRKLWAGWLALALALFGAALWTPPAQAHEVTRSVSSWSVEAGALEGVVTVDARTMTRVPGEDALDLRLARHVLDTAAAVQGGSACEIAAMPAPARTGFVRASVQVRCPAPIEEGGVLLALALFLSVDPAHIHVARIYDGAGEREAFPRPADTRAIAIEPGGEMTWPPSLENAPAEGAAGAFARGAAYGYGHVLGGWDHLAFLAALVLTARGWLRAAGAFTGFTIGHGATIALLWSGWVRPAPALIEALIAATIVLAAADYLRLRAGWRGAAGPLSVAGAAAGGAGLVWLALGWMFGGPPGAGGAWLGLAGVALAAAALHRTEADAARAAPFIAAAFGLVHGAGFAGSMREAFGDSFSLALFAGFNLGVEAAQAVAALGMGAFLWSLARLAGPRAAAHAQLAAAALILAAGCYWLGERFGA